MPAFETSSALEQPITDRMFEDICYHPPRRASLPAPPSLSAWIERVYCSQDPHPAPFRAVPDGCIDVRFDRRNPGQCIVVGQMTRWFHVTPVTGYEFISLRFFPHAARALLRVPLSEFQDQRVPIADVLPGGGELMESVANAPSTESALRVLITGVEARLRPAGISAQVETATRMIIASGGNIRIAELVRTLGFSRQRLNFLFLRDVGLCAKTFARVIRLRSTICRISPSAPDWAHLAVESGYYDQAHMIDEFKSLVGLTPEQYLHSRPPQPAH